MGLGARLAVLSVAGIILIPTVVMRAGGASESYLSRAVFARDTLREDTAMHESLQAGLASRAKSHVILQDNELAIRHFHRVLQDCIGAARRLRGPARLSRRRGR